MISGNSLFESPKHLFDVLGYNNTKHSLEYSQELLDKYLDKYLSGYLHVSDSLKSLLKAMLQLNPSFRPDPMEIISYPLFSIDSSQESNNVWHVKPVLKCLITTTSPKANPIAPADNYLKTQYESFKNSIPNIADFIVLQNPDYSSLTFQGT
jgi:serine/threonine protein kinase